MPKLNKINFQIRFKRKTSATINDDATKALALEGEPHWTTDTKQLYVFDGDVNVPINGIVRLSSTTVGMQTADGAQTLYTIPTGKTAYITHVIVRSPTASLAGGTDYDFTNWKQTVDLSSMTSTTDYMVLSDGTKYQELSAGTDFQITPNTGSTADADATIDVFGFLV